MFTDRTDLFDLFPICSICVLYNVVSVCFYNPYSAEEEVRTGETAGALGIHYVDTGTYE